MEDKIKVQKNEGENFTASFESGVYSEIGIGLTVKEAVENLFYKIESNEKESAEEKQKFFIEQNMEKAKKMAVDLFNVMGPDSFDIFKFKNKTGIEKEEAKLRLNFLANFGLVQPDRKRGVGMKFKIVIDSQTLQAYYYNEAQKWEATAKYYKALGEELSNVEKKIQEEVSSAETE